MSNQQQTLKLSAVIVLAAMLLTFTAAASYIPSVDAQGNSGKDKAAKEKAEKEKAAKVKKVSQKAKIDVDVDISQVDNITEASKAYSFVVQSGTYISKPKALDLSNVTEDVVKIPFNGKLTAVAGDAFSVTASSNSTEYQTVTSTGIFELKAQGNSGKSILVGTPEEPLVLQGIDSGVDELS